MTPKEIQNKITKLKSIMSEHNLELGVLEKQLKKSISTYAKALEKEKLKEVRDSLV